ncbi:hypothetical protein PGT21_021043 [Puccinia graminis f. sp. tritici]|uniref:Uncharacterized protein n=1 Tax=Puccinia graminis f. sp. tritici TaxID=56615 RepID=A0A5B0LSC1_PUCGR|nr:hypothetical protein PGT21_021043 [Puccinia graminis f. sp. tritici]KAA1091755.1 hypothetical protein PGTUg99_010895 [Puccinia graminis f. sp. tritici]
MNRMKRLTSAAFCKQRIETCRCKAADRNPAPIHAYLTQIAANKRGTGRRRAQHESWSNLVSTVHGLPLPVSEEEEEACTDPSTHCLAPDYTSTYTTNLTSTESD